MKQCFFVDAYKNTNFGILTDDGNIICLECGGVLEPDNFRLLEVYENWYSLEYYALCDCEEARDKWDIKFLDMTQEEFERWFDNVQSNCTIIKNIRCPPHMDTLYLCNLTKKFCLTNAAKCDII